MVMFWEFPPRPPNGGNCSGEHSLAYVYNNMIQKLMPISKV